MILPFKTRWAGRVRQALRRPVHAPEASETTAPIPPTPDWDEAFLRVESYLRAHQLSSRVLLNRRTTEIVGAARAMAQTHPAERPVTLAIRIAQARIGDWLVREIGEGDWADERFRARGRLALLRADVPQKRADLFLANESLPPGAREKLANAELQAGPEVRLGSMPASTLEFPLREAAEEKWTNFSRFAFMRSAASWLLIAGVATLTWWVTR